MLITKDSLLLCTTFVIETFSALAGNDYRTEDIVCVDFLSFKPSLVSQNTNHYNVSYHFYLTNFFCELFFIHQNLSLLALKTLLASNHYRKYLRNNLQKQQFPQYRNAQEVFLRTIFTVSIFILCGFVFSFIVHCS